MRRSTGRPGRSAPLQQAHPPRAAGTPLSHPALWVAALAVAAVLASSVSFELFEPDFWQHLLVGKAIWQTHSVPDRQIWTWPTYGVPDVTPSWLFRALIWPLWSIAGVWGLFAWRWVTTLAAFGLVWATARRMGARGFAALGVLLLCGLAYRVRSQIRPETLVSVLMALQVWLLESHRQGGPDRSAWVVVVAWVWANAHVSWYLGLVVLGAYGVDDALRARRGGETERSRLRRLGWILIASVAVSFLNPFGWRALWQPFDYFFHLRHEPLFADINELHPFDPRGLVSSGLILPLVGWPLLILWRLARRRADAAEILLCVHFAFLVLQSRRFLGFYLLAAAPFLMRDVDEWTAAARRVPWRAPIWARAGLLAALCAAAGYREWTRPDPHIGVAIDYENVPVRACDFIAENGIRGRAFNPFTAGGYLLYRFWPDRERLPFIDIHLAGGPGIRRDYRNALESAEGWRSLDDEFRFDYVLMDRFRYPGHPFLDVLDADSALALVFADDAAVVFVRRHGPLASVAERHAYRALPAGRAELGAIYERCARDSAFRAEIVRELERRAAGSRWNALTLDMLANLALIEGRTGEAHDLLERALRVNPWIARAHERLGLIALATGRPRDALREFEIERSLDPREPGAALHLGQAWQRLGTIRKAREWYRRELDLDPGNRAALDSLRVLGRAS